MGDNRRKITPRYAAKASHTSSSKRRRIHCSYAGDCRSARCACYKNGIRFEEDDADGPVKRKMIQLWFAHWEQLDP